MKLVATAVLALALAAPAAAASPKLSQAERTAITRSIDVFVNHAVKRVHPEAAYDIVAPEMRAGINRRAWARGDIPVYPFPARGVTHPWSVLYVTRYEVGLELLLMPAPGAKARPIIFHIYLRPAAGGRWLVDAFQPAATLAPLGAKPAVVAAADYTPQPRSDSEEGPGRLSGSYAYAPFAAFGLLLLGLAAWGVLCTIRDRRLRQPRGASPPPLPRSRT